YSRNCSAKPTAVKLFRIHNFRKHIIFRCILGKFFHLDNWAMGTPRLQNNRILPNLWPNFQFGCKRRLFRAENSWLSIESLSMLSKIRVVPKKQTASISRWRFSLKIHIVQKLFPNHFQDIQKRLSRFSFSRPWKALWQKYI